jgi:hypothetical protein
MGLFDIPAPLYTAIDSLLDFLPLYPRLLFWACVTGGVSMALYWLCSAQDKVAGAKLRAVAARKQMAAYKGAEFDEMWPLAKESLAASSRHFVVVIVPAILSSLPALTLMIWVSNHFSFRLPTADSAVNLWSIPADSLADLYPAEKPLLGYTLNWPERDTALPVRAVTGETLLTLPLEASVPVIHQRQWWNTLIANPNGYLPADAAVQEVHFDLPKIEYLALGPSWIRGWEFSYFALLVLVSLALKLVFKIH